MQVSQRKKVLIGGGGIAGLAAGKRLVDAGYDVEILVRAHPVERSRADLHARPG